MSLMNVSGLTFAYERSYDNIFEDVSFKLDTDWKLGFLGRNGRGKTTFLNLLLGRYEYKGTIFSAVPFEYFPYPVEDDSLITEEVIRGIHPEYVQWELMREFSLLELDDDALYRTFNTLSNGERTKILLAVLFLKEDRFLLIDEPTNHLDMHGRETVSKYLQKKKGFILVSHDRAFLDGCIDHVLSINKTNIEIQHGNFSSWLENKERQDNFELAENDKLKKDIKRLSSAAKRTSDWSDKVEKTKKATKNSGSKPDRGYIGHKSAKMMQRSKSIDQRRRSAIDQKSQLLGNVEESEQFKLTQSPFHTKRIVSFDNVSIFYDEPPVCSGLNFTVEQGERVALCGRNGSGKSSIIKLICGEDIKHSGYPQIANGLRISYVSQDTSMLEGGLSGYAAESGIEESLFKAILRKFGFSRSQFEKNIQDFSGGQKKQVLLARSLCERAHLLIWDEPLNFIDVISRMQIENLLLEYQPTIIFVEHDHVFTEKVSTKRVELS